MRFQENPSAAYPFPANYSSNVLILGCFFNRNLGKGGYASQYCSHMVLLYNNFFAVERGSMNLSNHYGAYVAYNYAAAEDVIESGYAAVRIPNHAANNVVVNNHFENHGRGIFVLSYSRENTIFNNTIRNTYYQGILVQGRDNLIEDNTIIDAGADSIRIADAYYNNYPEDHGLYMWGPPSYGQDNFVYANEIKDTAQVATGVRGLHIIASLGVSESAFGNYVICNEVDSSFGRLDHEIGCNHRDGVDADSLKIYEDDNKYTP